MSCKIIGDEWYLFYDSTVQWTLLKLVLTGKSKLFKLGFLKVYMEIT